MNVMAAPPVSYEFEPGKRSIFAEIYFPKKVAYQGAIFRALEDGLSEEYVRRELVGLAKLLLESELSVYPHWFDPDRYTLRQPRSGVPTLGEAEKRMTMYKSPFHGWSMYEVDGVFLSKRKRHGRLQVDEERTQVIRLIFVFNDRSEKRAIKAGHLDVYRAILYWVMSVYGHANYDAHWSDVEMDNFLQRHREWGSEKEAYARRHYRRLAGAITKWIDDCGLFIFGFLVRELWKEVVNAAEFDRARKIEDEIWVSSIFHFNINTMKPHKEQRYGNGILMKAPAKEKK